MDQKKIQKKFQTNPEEENKKLKEELEKIRKEVENFKNKYLRALADYQNYEKRVSGEKSQIREQVAAQVLLKLLPFLDNLDKAEIFIKDPGLKMVRDNFYKMLAEIGLTEIQILDKEFDPHLAEAVEVVEGDKDNVIKGILRKGYILNGKVIRVAQVRVTKRKIDQNKSN